MTRDMSLLNDVEAKHLELSTSIAANCCRRCKMHIEKLAWKGYPLGKMFMGCLQSIQSGVWTTPLFIHTSSARAVKPA